MIIALAGNPNSGKTTMYNALTGSSERVGNWAGVTVDKKMGTIKKSLYKGNDKLIAVDLPGAYSMSPFTSEECVTSAYVKGENPDVIINIVDATNLSRSLFFTTQLLELGIPMVVALNKSDINDKKETHIDVAELSASLGCPVIETVSNATTKRGLSEVIKAALSIKEKTQTAPYIQGEIDLTDKSAVEKADRARFEFVNELVKKVESRKVHTKNKSLQDKIDRIITHKLVGIPIFAVVMFLVFQISQAWVGPWLADILGGWLDYFKNFVGELTADASPILRSILVDGVIGGVIAVVGFLPLVMVMYFLMALLEDCGYMARVSVVLDPIFKKVGLSGKSVIPFVIGTGCAVPGVMACRTIRNERERRATAMLAPFMPCGAKLPVISLFAGTFFKNAEWIGTIMYFVGILVIFLGALLVNKITNNKLKKSYFIMELPEYKLPSFVNAAKSMLQRGWSFIVKAATIILVCNTAVQIMQTFTWGLEFIDYEGIESSLLANGVSQEVITEAIRTASEASILHSIAAPISYLFIPLIGFASWQLAAAAVTGFIAKENLVGTIAICYGITNLISTSDLSVVGEVSGIQAALGITPAAALAFLMFNLFSPPCFAAIGAMSSELKSGKWLAAGISLQLAMGYSIGFLVYQIGTLVTEGHLGNAFPSGLAAILLMILIVTVLIVKSSRKSAKAVK